jgi:hypothetical protein
MPFISLFVCFVFPLPSSCTFCLFYFFSLIILIIIIIY